MEEKIAAIIKEGQERTKRSIAKTIGLGFVVLAILTGLVWFNNIMVARQWNPQDGHGTTYHGPLPLFDRFAVDFTTVSTLIPFFGVLLIMVGFFRISRAKKNTNIPDYFPFFKSYIQITVALGLIGTVWGLIMIGYYPPETVQMEQLILCLRTALYSTLVALIWVFLFVFPIKSIMQYGYRVVSGRQNPKATENVLSVLNELGSVASGAAEELSKAGNEFMEVGNQASETKTKLGEFMEALTAIKDGANELLSRMDSTVQKWEETAEEQKKAAEEQQKAVQGLKKLQQGFNEDLDRERKRRRDAEEKATKVERERDEAKSKLRKFVDYAKQMLRWKGEEK